MKSGQITTMLIVTIAAMILIIAHFIYQKIYEKMKQQAKEEIIADGIAKEATTKFYSINADLQQHLKDDGFIEPKPGSEEHFQRWKAEREKQKP